MARIENALFSNYSVPYCGAFYINSKIDLFVNSVQIFNLKATSHIDTVSGSIGAPGFAFIGNDFYDNNIYCGDNLWNIQIHYI